MDIVIRLKDEETYDKAEYWAMFHDNDHDPNRSHSHLKIPCRVISNGTPWKRPIIAIDQCQLHSLRQELIKKKYLLFEVYQSELYYLCSIDEMKLKVLQHFTQTEAYVLIKDVNQSYSHPNDYSPININEHYVAELLQMIQNKLEQLLTDLQRRHAINSFQSQQMRMNTKRIRLDYLSFQPDTQYVNFSRLIDSFNYFSSAIIFIERRTISSKDNF